MMSEAVLFCEGRYYFLSNFSSFSVYWRKNLWMTSEHAYQAAKFTNKKLIRLIRNARSAYDAKKLARANQNVIRANWNEIKLGIMEEILRAKLNQYPHIARKLLETGNADIIEDSPKDAFWGRGPDHRGENHLGKIWMKLRDELKR